MHRIAPLDTPPLPCYAIKRKCLVLTSAEDGRIRIMKLLSLERLIGPGKSVDENFEIMCLELVNKAGDGKSRAHRNLPPDGGIDIYEPDRLTAYQCKAYSQFRSDIITAISKSAEKAKNNLKTVPFDAYVLMIPFVPTQKQRGNIEKAMKIAKSYTYICDGDEIESRLFEHPEVASRFFQSVIVIFPPQGEIVLKTDDPRPMVQLFLKSEKTGQRIPISASPNVTCEGLLNYLNFILKLPSSIRLLAGNLLEQSEEIRWFLSVMRDGNKSYLDHDVTLEKAGISDGDIIFLGFKYDIRVSYGYSKDIGLRDSVELFSKIWEDHVMGEKLIRAEKSHPVEQQKDNMIREYIEFHLSNIHSLVQ
jgi:hypothetical protein